MYEKSIRITEHYLDGLNHVNYLNYVRMMGEVAFEEYRAERGIDLATLRDRHDLALVIAELKVKYFQPLRLDDVARVRVAKPVVNGKRLEAFATIAKGTHAIAEIEMIMVPVRYSTGRGCEIPESVLANISEDCVFS